MTEATAIRPSNLPSTAPKIHYQVAMPQPQSHLFEVILHVQDWQKPVLDLKMPVWTPGSYLVREYSKHLQNFSASTSDGKSLASVKVSKNHWRVTTANVSEVIISYRIFANELTVRTNHLDTSHGYFNGAALFFYIPGFEQESVQVTIVPPYPEWQVTTALPAVTEKTNTFIATDFDTLVDSPFEIGSHQLYDFEVLGKPHQLAIWGQGNANPERIISDIKRIVEVESELFQGLPYDRYIFLLHLASQGAGGLEHKNCCTLNYSRLGFRGKDQYDRFMQLVAHEFFHLWNVKRLRPKALETFDYEAENYTPSLWFSEGTTSYYDLIIPYWAKIYDVKTYIDSLSKEISRFLTTPGRLIQPVSESSFDAWIKLYRPDANSGNSQISYYLKGELVSFLLDLLIRARHENKRSLNDVMLLLWQKFGQDEIGFTPEQLQQTIESIAGIDLSSFFAKYVDGTDELPFDLYLEPFGLKLQADKDDELPFIGITAKTENGREIIKFVEYNSPAQKAGIDAGDELLALNGLRVSADQLSDRLKDYKPEDTVQLTVFHQDQLYTGSIKLALPCPKSYRVVPLENPSSLQKQNFTGWLGVDWDKISE